MSVGAQNLTQVMSTLHDDPRFRFELLADLAGVDTGSEMWVVYHLWSTLTPDWLRVIVPGLERDDPRVPSVTYLWKGAEWAEREAYDMFGIIFEGNRAAQGLPAGRRFGALGGRRLSPCGADAGTGRQPAPAAAARGQEHAGG
jgi:NADH-quinone oxidoreductase subunit C